MDPGNPEKLALYCYAKFYSLIYKCTFTSVQDLLDSNQMAKRLLKCMIPTTPFLGARSTADQ